MLLRSNKLHQMIAAVITLVMVLMVASGCTNANRKPLPPAPTQPRTSPFTPAPARKPIVTTPAEAHRLAQTLAMEANKVPGVRKTTVVVSGTTAFVGLELDKEITARQTDMIKKDVATRIKKMETRITLALVATDPDTMTRLNKIADGIKGGTPVSSFVTELSEIARRLTPTAR